MHNYRFFQTKSIYLAIVRQYIFVLTKITCIYRYLFFPLSCRILYTICKYGILVLNILLARYTVVVVLVSIASFVGLLFVFQLFLLLLLSVEEYSIGHMIVHYVQF